MEFMKINVTDDQSENLNVVTIRGPKKKSACDAQPK